MWLRNMPNMLEGGTARPLAFMRYIVQLPPDCIEALVLLLNQIQKKISVDWLAAVILSEDPEQCTITVPATGGNRAQHDNGSHWTNSTTIIPVFGGRLCNVIGVVWCRNVSRNLFQVVSALVSTDY